MIETDTNNTLEVTESIELSVSTKDKYTWTIKVRSKIIDDACMNRLEFVDKKLREKYGCVAA